MDLTSCYHRFLFLHSTSMWTYIMWPLVSCRRHLGNVCFWRWRIGGGGGDKERGGRSQCSLHGVQLPPQTELHLCSDLHDGVVHHIRVLANVCPAAVVMCPLDDARASPVHTDVITMVGCLWQLAGHFTVHLQLPSDPGSPRTVPQKRRPLQGARL